MEIARFKTGMDVGRDLCRLLGIDDASRHITRIVVIADATEPATVILNECIAGDGEFRDVVRRYRLVDAESPEEAGGPMSSGMEAVLFRLPGQDDSGG